MLLHGLLFVDDETLRGQLSRAFVHPDVLWHSLPVPGAAPTKGTIAPAGWTSLATWTSDIVVISRSLLPAEPRQLIDSLGPSVDGPDVVVLSNQEDSQDRARLLAAGYTAVLLGSLPENTLAEVLTTICQRRRLRVADKPIAFADRPRLSDFVSRSLAMQSFLETVQRVSKSATSLLIMGETGTGKERLAQAIHADSTRARGPFIAVNCGAFAENLLESELFGHEQGAFTGAHRARRGCFELAHHGTLFLDEIGEMPIHLQVKLLRVLQERQVQRLGAERPNTVDVRIIAATNRDLSECVKAGRFRSDLYYRLCVVALTIPPLRERRADIPDLVAGYLKLLQPKISSRVQTIEPMALAALQAYDWPGNVRELINVIERGMLLCPGEIITLADLPDEVCRSLDSKLAAGGAGPTYPFTEGTTSAFSDSNDAYQDHRASGLSDRPALAQLASHFAVTLPEAWLRQPLREIRQVVWEAVEKQYLQQLLAQTHGRINETAKRAGLSPRAVFSKMRQYHLQKEAFKAS